MRLHEIRIGYFEARNKRKSNQSDADPAAFFAHILPVDPLLACSTVNWSDLLMCQKSQTSSYLQSALSKLLVGWVALWQGGCLVFASEFSPEQIEFFESKVRPVLVENCLDCHTGTKARVGLELNHRQGWLRGSDYRKVINEQEPAESIILHAIRHTGKHDAPRMPEDSEPIAEDQAADIEAWIKMGLPWPEEQLTEKPDDPFQHWSFQPVNPPSLPEEFTGNAIDYFVEKRQSAAGVKRAPRADRYTLLRRLTLDLTGLPPSWKEMKAFQEDDASDQEALLAAIDRLLKSPHYGERWARHWMDVARYSDTKGYEAGGRDRRFVYSYTYRDWLIRAFQDDIPFDQFLLYQLAAEQLVKGDSPDKHHLAAMGFISLSKNGKTELVIDDRLDTTFRGMMGLTVSCARCHDHKFDPVSTKEYYGIYGVFANSMQKAEPLIRDPEPGPKLEEYRKKKGELEKKVTDFINSKVTEMAKQKPELAKKRPELVKEVERNFRGKIRSLRTAVDKFVADQGMEGDRALIVKDLPKARPQHVYIRGNPARRGEVAPSQFLQAALPGKTPVPFESGSGRLEMAKAIASADNPLTARVIVNRIWMWHFGEGIVRTVSDFGTQGEKPDHPELLEYLADWFVENGWSVKKLHRLILQSETWAQQAANPSGDGFLPIDPENRLLWKFPRKRLDLEQLRDGMLAVTGELDRKLYGRTEKILEAPYSLRRSVYGFIDRQNLNPVFRTFDFSNPQETTGKRPDTTIPMQALFTLNSEFSRKRAQYLAVNTAVNEDRIASLHRAVFARPPSDEDRQLAESFLSSYHSEWNRDGKRQTNSEWSYGYGNISEGGAVSFTAFPHWEKDRWQISAEYPLKDDPRSYLRAEASGNTHPGNTDKESVIYQWQAPTDMTIRISGMLRRDAVGKGNGLRAKIHSEAGGIVGEFDLTEKSRSISCGVDSLVVKKNELVHFVLEPKNNTAFDSANWAPLIARLDKPGEQWSFREDFSGPADLMDSWQAYAQALLNSNRFLFID